MGTASESVNLPNFTWNGNQYNASYILSDGTKSLQYNQDMIREFSFTDSIENFESVGARGQIILDDPNEFIESSVRSDQEGFDNLNKDELHALYRLVFKPPLMADGSFGDKIVLSLSEGDRSPSLDFRFGDEELLLRVDIFPVGEDGEIFASKYPNANRWIDSFLFSVIVVKDPEGEPDRKVKTLQLEEKIIYDFKKITSYDLRYDTTDPNNGELNYTAEWRDTEKTGIVFSKLLTEAHNLIISNDSNGYTFESRDMTDHALTGSEYIADGKTYLNYYPSPQVTVWQALEYAFTYHQGDADYTNVKYSDILSLPLFNFLKLEKPITKYKPPLIESVYGIEEADDPTSVEINSVGSPISFRKFSIRSFEHFFNATRTRITAAREDGFGEEGGNETEQSKTTDHGVGISLNENSKHGHYMLETFFIQGDADCMDTVDPHGEETRYVGLTHNLPPGQNNFLFDYHHEPGPVLINQILTDFRVLEETQDTGNKAFQYIINCWLYCGMYQDILQRAFSFEKNKDIRLSYNCSQKSYQDVLSESGAIVARETNVQRSSQKLNTVLETGSFTWWSGPDELPRAFAALESKELPSGEDSSGRPIIKNLWKILYHSSSTKECRWGLRGLMKWGKLSQSQFLYGVEKLSFVTEGLTLREPGRFIKIEKSGAEMENPKDQKMVGYWFIIQIDNHYKGQEFFQTLYCVKPYRIAN